MDILSNAGMAVVNTVPEETVNARPRPPSFRTITRQPRLTIVERMMLDCDNGMAEGLQMDGGASRGAGAPFIDQHAMQMEEEEG